MDPAHRLTFAAMGWTPSVQPDETFVGVVDMGGFLDHLQSGSVNVQINDDTGLDWAIYVATVATPIVGAAAGTFSSMVVAADVDTAIAPIEVCRSVGVPAAN